MKRWRNAYVSKDPNTLEPLCRRAKCNFAVLPLLYKEAQSKCAIDLQMTRSESGSNGWINFMDALRAFAKADDHPVSRLQELVNTYEKLGFEDKHAVGKCEQLSFIATLALCVHQRITPTAIEAPSPSIIGKKTLPRFDDRACNIVRLAGS